MEPINCNEAFSRQTSHEKHVAVIYCNRPLVLRMSTEKGEEIGQENDGDIKENSQSDGNSEDEDGEVCVSVFGLFSKTCVPCDHIVKGFYPHESRPKGFSVTFAFLLSMENKTVSRK